MFKRKGDKQDVIHQTNIKRGITSHFARTLKVLQHRHLQPDSDEFIYSDDFSNNLCSALEAVFLHGLKDSVVAKMSSYVGFVNTQDQAQFINFWSLCAKFTHKDVITQLRGLAQINTEIGLSRAWIRLALNDGLMESYLHSMIVDHKLLAYYYHSYSYLRDHEQPGILKNFLTGLMSLSFKLSFNSSVLNTWSNTSLLLAGLLDSQHVPSPAVSNNSSQFPSAVVPGQPNSKHQDDPIVVTKHSKSDIRGHDGVDAPMFSSIRDVEEIRRLTLVKMAAGAPSVASEGSTSSHISCPDPGANHASSCNIKEIWEKGSDSGSVISPALYPRADREIIAKEDEKKSIQGSDTQSVNSLSTSDIISVAQSEESRRDSKSSVIVEDSSPFFELELARSPPRPRSRRVTDDDLKTPSPRTSTIVSSHSSTCHSLSNSPKPCDFALDGATGGSAPKEIIMESKEMPQDFSAKKLNSGRLSPKQMTVPRGIEEICATLPPLKLDPLEQEAILKKVLGEFDEQADRDREKREEQRVAISFDEAFVDTKVTEQREVEESQVKMEEKQKKDAPDSGISLSPCSYSSQFMDNGLAKDDLSAVRRKRSPAFRDSDAPVRDEQTLPKTNLDKKPPDNLKAKINDSSNKKERKVDESEVVGTTAGTSDMDSSPSGNYGNSLSGMMGWSSEIETSPQERNNRRLREKTRGESFASMLKTYAGQNSLISTTLDQVIQTFYGTDQQANDSPPSAAGFSADDDKEMNDVNRQDSCLEDFEILTAPTHSFNGIHDMDSSRSIFLFRIPREHGLSHQNFTCRGCSRPIGIIYGQPRLCEFDGGLYCYECHENNETYIPSYIVYNWDFSKKKVCVENYRFLQELEDQALYDLDDLNTKLEAHVPELKNLKVLRQQLCFLKSYMFNCTQKVAESLRQKVWPREHMYERPSVYSVNDFHQVLSGSMTRFVKDLVKFASKHVYECSLCSQKGFVCEICRNPQVIFPFELDTTIRCSTCKSVYHKTCLTESLPCPKCQRWGKRYQNSEKNKDHPEDYGMSPSF